MIHFEGFDEIINKTYDFNQEHVFKYWDKLSHEEKENLLSELSVVDFQLLTKQFESTKKTEEKVDEIFSPDYISSNEKNSKDKSFDEAKIAGEKYIKEAKVAAFVVAGGQGTRLGLDGPKGMVKVSPVKEKSLFQIFSEKILFYSKKFNISIPFIIMTSVVNHQDTVNFFKDNNYFGLREEDVIFFSQKMIPSLDEKGKLILTDKNKIFRNPDGHGGSLSALNETGVLKKLKERGIKTLSYFQVDNPLVKILDPDFIGFHLLNKSEVSNKAVKKVGPEEKVGVFTNDKDNNLSVIEYSNLSTEDMNKKKKDGSLEFNMGNIAIHLFELDFIERITSDEISLPFHTARKKIKSYSNGKISEINGIKFEKFIFDALPLAKNSIIFEVIREKEFAPIKNREGVDSLETSQKLMSDLHKKWLAKKEIYLPDDYVVEISPLTGLKPEDLPDSIHMPDSGKIYI